MPGPKKTNKKPSEGIKVTNVQVRPSPDGTQIQGRFGFDSPIGNSQINGFASENFKQIGLQHTYPISNIGTGLFVSGGGNYSAFNYPGQQGSDLSGNLAMNYKRSFGKNKNTDLDLTASLDLNKAGLSPGFNVGLVRRFPNGGVITEEKEDPLAALNSNDISKFMFDSRQNTFQSDPFAQFKANVAKCGKNKSCAEGAFNYWANYLSPYLHQPAIRDIHNQYVNIPQDAKLENPQFSMKSRPRLSWDGRERLHNQSLDSWELYNVYNKTDAGSVFWDGKKQGEFKFTPENLKNIPIGAIITQGETEGSITAPGNPQSSHTTTVIGFDYDGHPLIYDGGQVHRLGESWHYEDVNDTYRRVNDIFIPKGYEDFTYSKMKDRDSQYKTKLGYIDEEGNPVANDPNKYSRFYINDIKNSLDSNEAKIGEHYNISKDFMDKIQNRVIGLGAKESNFNNFGDIKQADGEDPFSWKQQYGDSEPVNLLVKPAIKKGGNLLSSATDAAGDLFDSREQKDDWQVEVILKNRFKRAGKSVEYGSDEWNKAYNELRAEFDKKSQKPAGIQKSSRGPYKIKDFPESATKLLKDKDGEPLDKGDLTLWGEDVNELRYGANVAAIHLIENINKFKKKYADKNLTDDQLLDLATVAYNNQGKSLSPEFVDNFIKDNYLKDGYLENVKRFEKLYLQDANTTLAGSAANPVSGFSAEDLKRLKENAAAAQALTQNAYGGPLINYGNGGAISPDDNDYNTFVKTLPPNLRNTDTSDYNLRGYWEALGKPAQFDYSQPKEADGHHHAFSRNPQTGEILKKENHPTFRMAIEGDMQAGYIPYKNKATGKIHTFNEEPDMSKFEVYNTAPLYDNLYLAQGGPLMPYMFPQQMKGGGQFWSKFGAGATGALQGVAGSLLPGAAGDWAVKGIGAVHGMIDKDITDADRAIMGGARAVGAGVTAVATGGATLAAGADDMVIGTKDAIKSGTEWGQKNAAALDVVGNLAGTVAGGAAGGAAGGGGMQGALKGAGQSLMPGQTGAGSTFTGGTAGNTGGFTGQQNMNGSNNINMDNLNNILGGFSGQGGINPQQIMQFAQMFGQNAYGGPIQMANGGLTSIENGGTHEQNPMGGVPVGPNALVEEGETIMDLKDAVAGGKFVFSDRRGPKGKKGSTWADLSKRVERKYKDRKGDAAAKRAMDRELVEIAKKQEEQKAKEMAKLKKQMTELSPTTMPMLPPGMQVGAPQSPQGMGQGMPQIPGQTPPNLPPMPQGMPQGMPQMAANGGVLYNMGGPIYAPGGPIKYSNGGGWAGLFNHGQAWDLAGMQAYADTNKLDWNQLAAEAQKAGLNLGDIGAAGSTNIKSFGPKTLAAINALQGNQPGAIPTIDVPQQGEEAKLNLNQDPPKLEHAKKDDGTDGTDGTTTTTNTNFPFTGGEPYQAPYGSVALGQLGNSLGDMHSIYTGMFNKGDVPEFGKMDPKHIDLHVQRQALKKEAGNTLESVRQGMRKAGDISSLVAAHSTLNENLGQGLAKSYSDEENFNTMLDNKAQEFNIGQDEKEAMFKVQRDEIAKQRVNEGLHGIGENIGQGVKDIRDHEAVDKRNRLQLAAINATSKNFNWDDMENLIKFYGA